MGRPVADLVTRVAEHTTDRDMESEDWEKGIAVNGLLAVGEHTAEAQALIDRAIETQTSQGQFNYGWGDYPKDWEGRAEFVSGYKPNFNQSALGHGVLEFYDRTGDVRYRDAADRHWEFIRSVKRTRDGGLSHRHDVVELWVDALYFIAPFMARYGRVTDTPAAIEEATEQLLVHAKHLQDPHTGLWRHNWREKPDSYPQSTYWSRGVGWATTAIVDTLAVLSDDHTHWKPLVEILHETVTTLVDLQDESGFFHHILDTDVRERSPLETSGTCMFAYTIKRGVDLGVLDDRFEASAERAMSVCKGVVSEEGAVRRVADKPGGPGAPLTVTSFGQGWFLMAANEFL